MFFGLEPKDNNTGDSEDYSTHDFVDGDDFEISGKNKHKVKIGKNSDEYDSEINWRKKSGYKKRKKKNFRKKF